MNAEEYLKQSGYNENYPIGARQICRLMEGYAKSQLKERDKQIRDIIADGDDPSITIERIRDLV